MFFPASEASREVANLTLRKDPHTHLYIVSKNLPVKKKKKKKFVCLSVCLSVAKFDLNYLRTGEIEWADIFFRISLSKSHIPNFFSRQGAGMVWAEGQKIILNFFISSLIKSKIKTISNKFASLGARAVLVCPFLLK